MSEKVDFNIYLVSGYFIAVTDADEAAHFANGFDCLEDNDPDRATAQDCEESNDCDYEHEELDEAGAPITERMMQRAEYCLKNEGEAVPFLVALEL